MSRVVPFLNPLEVFERMSVEPDPGVAMPDDEYFGDVEGGDAPTNTRIALLDGPALAEPLPPLEYLIREIGLAAGGGAPHLGAGYGFTGKTITWQAAGLALVAHRSVWGAYKAPKPFRVVHVDLEQGERLTRRRYQRLALAMGIELAKLGDGLAVAVMPPLSLSAEHADAWREIMTGRDLAIVDSLRAATAGADENDSGIRAGLDMLGSLSEATGCRALVIHHARKPAGDEDAGRYAIRGSSAIYDACDSVYVFSAAKGEPVLVEHVKARSHGEPTEPIALVIEDVERHDVATVSVDRFIEIYVAQVRVADRTPSGLAAVRIRPLRFLQQPQQQPRHLRRSSREAGAVGFAIGTTAGRRGEARQPDAVARENLLGARSLMHPRLFPRLHAASTLISQPYRLPRRCA